MNEEEKKAIEFMNNIEYKQVNSDKFYDNRDIVLNLIKKQQKEIENRLNEIKCLYNFISIREERIDELVEINEKYNDLYISKDKIKEKIKELESHIWKDGYMTKFDKYAIHYLKELFGE